MIFGGICHSEIQSLLEFCKESGESSEFWSNFETLRSEWKQNWLTWKPYILNEWIMVYFHQLVWSYPSEVCKRYPRYIHHIFFIVLLGLITLYQSLNEKTRIDINLSSLIALDLSSWGFHLSWCVRTFE